MVECDEDARVRVRSSQVDHADERAIEEAILRGGIVDRRVWDYVVDLLDESARSSALRLRRGIGSLKSVALRSGASRFEALSEDALSKLNIR